MKQHLTALYIGRPFVKGSFFVCTTPVAGRYLIICRYMVVWVELIQDGEESYIALLGFLYSFRCEAIWLCEVTSIGLLLHVGIKVADEQQISLVYVRGSNIYLRGYLDLPAWSLNLRTQMRKYHYGKALFIPYTRIDLPPTSSYVDVVGGKLMK